MHPIRHWITLVEKQAPVPDCAVPCLYHATFPKHVPGIMKYGLGGKPSKANFDVSRTGTVYLTNHPNVAENYAKEALLVQSHRDDDDDEDIVVLEIDQAQLNPALLHVDPNDTGVMLDMTYDDDGPSMWDDDEEDEGEATYHSYEYHGVIPPSAIKISYTI